MRRYITITVFALFIFSSQILGHSGRTDSNGGHYNRKTGEYHYHNGGGGSGNQYQKEGGGSVIGWVIIIIGGVLVWMLFSKFMSQNDAFSSLNGYTIHKVIITKRQNRRQFNGTKINNSVTMYEVRLKGVTVAQFITKGAAEYYAETH